MQNDTYYMSLPFDVSGSRSKNRFRLELLWGISKMLDIYDTSNFTVVFDYVCDIEVHTDEGFEFYQIKTHKGEKTYNEKDIVKKKNGHSILGKLYVLRKEEHPDVRLAIVSNAYFKDGKKVMSNYEEIELSELSQSSKEIVITALKDELDIENISIKDVFYLHTSMNLNEPENDIIGKIVTSFTLIKGCEPKKPNALYRLIYDTVSTKACYELDIHNYENIVNHKGITKIEFDGMLNCHLDIADNSVELTKQYIDSDTNYKTRRMKKSAFAALFRNLQFSMELQLKEKEIAKYIIDYIETLPDSFEETIDHIVDQFGTTFSPEYSATEIFTFIILILKRFEEGVYDE